jgi:hypothetical protein
MENDQTPPLKQPVPLPPSGAPPPPSSSSTLVPSVTKSLQDLHLTEQKLHEQLVKVQKERETLLMKEEERIEKEKKYLAKEREIWSQMKGNVEELLKISRNKIKLNIGGKIFTTTVDTLTKEPASLFSSMFSGNFVVEPDKDGEIFIDRSYEYFHLILNFLRTGLFPIDGL